MPYIFIILILGGICALIGFNIVIVPQEHTYVIERLGKYKTSWTAGLHVKIPVIEKIIKKISLKEQDLDFPPQPVITKDNVIMDIDAVVFAKVFDSRLYTYGVENPISSLQNLTATTLRNIIGSMELDQTLVSRDEINAKLLKILDEATDKWGIKVTRVELKNINPPDEIRRAMEKEMKAEREKRQTVLEAQAHQEAVIARAEGDKQAKILAAEAERDAKIALAEGEARAIEEIAKANARGLELLKQANIDDKVLKLKGLEALKDVADGNATKIFMPTDISKLISTLGVTSEALNINKPATKQKVKEVEIQDLCEDHHTSKVSKEILNRG